jgi:hypothetical protein
MGTRLDAVRSDSGLHVCGTVNTVSASGANSAERPFYVMGNRSGQAFVLVEIGGRPRKDQTVQLMCQIHGIRQNERVKQ